MWIVNVGCEHANGQVGGRERGRSCKKGHHAPHVHGQGHGHGQKFDVFRWMQPRLAGGRKARLAWLCASVHLSTCLVSAREHVCVRPSARRWVRRWVCACRFQLASGCIGGCMRPSASGASLHEGNLSVAAGWPSTPAVAHRVQPQRPIGGFPALKHPG